MPDEPQLEELDPEEGDPTPESDPSPNEGIWREGLPDEWKGKTPQEIARVWGTAATLLDSKNNEVEALRQQLESLKSASPTPQPASPEPEEPIDFKSLIFDDPERAVDLAVEKKYGKRVQEYERELSNVAVMKVEREFADFDEYRDTVNAILSNAQGRVTDQDVRSAYLLARGYKSVQDEREAAQAVHNEPPSPPEPTKKTPEIPELGKAMMSSLGFQSEEEMDEWLNSDDDMEIEVPHGNA